MRTMKHTYRVEVAFLNTESDDINVDYISKLPFVSHITVISIERK